jgi:hypothetical protein
VVGVARRDAEWEIDRQRCHFCYQLPSADRVIVSIVCGN